MNDSRTSEWNEFTKIWYSTKRTDKRKRILSVQCMGFPFTNMTKSIYSLEIPGDHILGSDLIDLPFAEIRKDLSFDNVLFRLPGAFFQPCFEICGVDLNMQEHICAINPFTTG